MSMPERPHPLARPTFDKNAEHWRIELSTVPRSLKDSTSAYWQWQRALAKEPKRA